MIVPEIVQRFEGVLGPMVKVAPKCQVCGEVTLLDLPADRFEAWVGGELVQVAFPELPIDDREILAVGLCAPCSDKLWGVEG